MIGDGKSWAKLALEVIRTYSHQYGRKLTRREKRLLIKLFFSYPPVSLKEIDRRLEKRVLNYRFKKHTNKRKHRKDDWFI